MREAYLINKSQSITSIPLFQKIPTTYRGREILKVQFKTLVPGEELILGTKVSPEEKKHYLQFKPIMIELKYREVQEEQESPAEEIKEEENITESPADEIPADEIPADEIPADEIPEEVEGYEETTLMKKRQAELLEIAKGLGIKATAQDSKASITKMILEKQKLG